MKLNSLVALVAGLILARLTSLLAEPLRANGRQNLALTIDFLPIILGVLALVYIWLKSRS